MAAAQGDDGGAVGARGEAEADTAGGEGEGLEHAELFGDDERWVVGEHLPPEPSRMRSVWALTRASSSAGWEVDTPGMEWCSATQ